MLVDNGNQVLKQKEGKDSRKDKNKAQKKRKKESIEIKVKAASEK
jgi:hypothetical protein